MASKEFQQLQSALEQAPTEEARKQAADALKKYLAAAKERRQSLSAKRPGSEPLLVNLGLGKSYPSTIALEDMPTQVEKNPAFYTLMQKLLTAK